MSLDMIRGEVIGDDVLCRGKLFYNGEPFQYDYTSGDKEYVESNLQQKLQKMKEKHGVYFDALFPGNFEIRIFND